MRRIRRRDWTAAVWLGALGAVVISAAWLAWGHAVTTHEEVAATILGIPTLAFTAITVFLVAPRPARLEVQRQSELDVKDLIFFVYPQPAAEGEQQVPRDFLLQLHLAVANLGGRKGVLSRVDLHELRTDDGVAVRLPDVPVPLQGSRWVMRSGWINHERYFENLNELPPYVLEPDDVVTIRLRARRGVDWEPRWSLAELQSLADALSQPITHAVGEIVWRCAGKVRRESFRVEVSVAQQDLYRRCLAEITQGFSVRPMVEPRSVLLGE